MNRFTVFYADGSEFSGDPFKGEWKKIDDAKQIIKVQYVRGNACIFMEGYEEYNHTLECVGLGQKGISRILLMGRTSGDTEIIVLDIRQHKIYKDFAPRYREYGSQILDGWQQGKLSTPKCFFKKIPNV